MGVVTTKQRPIYDVHRAPFDKMLRNHHCHYGNPNIMIRNLWSIQGERLNLASDLKICFLDNDEMRLLNNSISFIKKPNQEHVVLRNQS